MTPETNHDTEISIYHDFLEDQGIVVDRTPEEQDQWHYESKPYAIGGGVVGGGVGGFRGVGGGVVGGVVGVVRVGGGVGGIGEYGVGSISTRIGG